MNIIDKSHADNEANAAVRKAAESALFHYWNCGRDNACGKLHWSMAKLAEACGWDDPGSEIDVREELALGDPDDRKRTR